MPPVLDEFDSFDHDAAMKTRSALRIVSTAKEIVQLRLPLEGVMGYAKGAATRQGQCALEYYTTLSARMGVSITSWGV
jgi:hypothetical protein